MHVDTGSRDPWVEESNYDRIDREDGPTLHLVGVVHDHPASVARVRAVVRATTPDVLALELPPPSLALYRQFAADDDPRGGEMSAAIDAAPDATVVGIDPLDTGLLVGMGRTLVREGHSAATAWSVARRTVRIARRVTNHRLVATGLRDLSTVDRPTTYGCEDAAPAEQVDHETDHLSRCSLLRAVTGRPPTVHVSTTVRERRMAEKLDALGNAEGPSTGDRTSEIAGDVESVVAVVGWSHLDSLVERLDCGERTETN